MTRFGNLSLRLKLVLVMSISSGLGLLVAMSAIIGNEVGSFARRARETMGAMTQMIGMNVSAAIVFDDPLDAEDSLRVLRTDPDIVVAALYRRDGRLFAQYLRAGEPAARVVADAGAVGATFVGHHMVVIQPVEHKGERVGVLYVRSDLRRLYGRLVQYIGLTVLIMGLGLGVAVMAARVLARRLAAPIYALAGVAKDVTKNKDYSVRAVEGAGAEIGVLVGAFNEMLEQIQAREQALHQTQGELELRVRERTAQLEASNRTLSNEVATRQAIQLELVQARDRAEAANRAKSTFLANISHDLRTPLTAVIGYSELMEEEAVRNGHGQYAHDLRQIEMAAGQLLALLSDLLDLSKIEAGKMEINPSRFDLGEFMQELVDTVRPLCDSRRNRLQLVCPPDAGSLETDRARLRQVLLNLISNAAKFTENGSVDLAVERTWRDGRARVVIAVRDSGIGMSGEQIQHVFEPFVQGSRDTALRYGGSGLGLAICKRYCDLMGAELEVESRLGGGTLFRVCFWKENPASENPATDSSSTQS